jgi:DNA (cytosine-5)-methyltransferase 1
VADTDLASERMVGNCNVGLDGGETRDARAGFGGSGSNERLANTTNNAGIKRCELHLQRGSQDNAKQDGMGSEFGGLADTRRAQWLWGQDASGFNETDAGQRQQDSSDDQPCSSGGGMADTAMCGRKSVTDEQAARVRGTLLQQGKFGQQFGDLGATLGDTSKSSPTNGFWRDADWLFCRDGKWRPVEPSTFPLARGSAARVGRLRGYGNAIVAQAAQGFIESVMD